jgi:hypothetical protein
VYISRDVHNWMCFKIRAHQARDNRSARILVVHMRRACTLNKTKKKLLLGAGSISVTGSHRGFLCQPLPCPDAFTIVAIVGECMEATQCIVWHCKDPGSMLSSTALFVPCIFQAPTGNSHCRGSLGSSQTQLRGSVERHDRG